MEGRGASDPASYVKKKMGGNGEGVGVGGGRGVMDELVAGEGAFRADLEVVKWIGAAEVVVDSSGQEVGTTAIVGKGSLVASMSDLEAKKVVVDAAAEEVGAAATIVKGVHALDLATKEAEKAVVDSTAQVVGAAGKGVQASDLVAEEADKAVLDGAAQEVGVEPVVNLVQQDANEYDSNDEADVDERNVNSFTLNEVAKVKAEGCTFYMNANGFVCPWHTNKPKGGNL